MNAFYKNRKLAECVAAGVMLTQLSGAIAQSTQPTTAPAAIAALRTNDQIVESLQKADQQLSELFGDGSAMTDSAKREALAPQAIPLVRQMLADFADLVLLRPGIKPNIDPLNLQLLALASALGDAQATDQLKTMAASKDADESLRGQMGELATRWTLAGTQADAQGQVVDAIQKLAEAHTDSAPLTILAMQLAQGATSDAKTRLNKIATETMKNPTASQIKLVLGMEQATRRLRESLGKPFTLTGTTVGGAAFTTADLKGKVVLVDFWATWCGPCIGELPHLLQLYADNHAKGLEIVGVSNDYSAQALQSFTAKQNMPWPQLFDKAAADDQQWNPITQGYGINAIPTMFLIDRKGVLRSINAREDVDTLLPKLLAE